MNCPFCDYKQQRIELENDLAVAIFDGYPVAKGHSLIIPKRHFGSIFEASKEEQAAMLSLLTRMRERLTEAFNPDGFNVGINDGIAAGQTVMHLHIHLIPRYVGDCEDPRGGVRWVFPSKAEYWSEQ